jgi:hypothetical protein
MSAQVNLRQLNDIIFVLKLRLIGTSLCIEAMNLQFSSLVLPEKLNDLFCIVIYEINLNAFKC